MGPGEPQQGHIINQQTNLTSFFQMSDRVPVLQGRKFPLHSENTENGQKELTKAKERGTFNFLLLATYLMTILAHKEM